MFCFYILPSFAVNVAVTVHLRRDEIPSNFIDEKCVVLTIQKCHTITRSLFIKRSYIKILPHRTYGLIFSKIILHFNTRSDIYTRTLSKCNIFKTVLLKTSFRNKP